MERYAPTPNNLRATHLSADYNMLQLLGRVFLLATTVCGASTAGAVGEAGAASGATLATTHLPARELSAAEFVEALQGWDKDYVVMLHASWCRYCKQFKPIWHEVSRAVAMTSVRGRTRGRTRRTMDSKAMNAHVAGAALLV